jgi:hypothetical protein
LGFEGIEDGALGNRVGDFELDLGARVGEGAEMSGKGYANHGASSKGEFSTVGIENKWREKNGENGRWKSENRGASTSLAGELNTKSAAEARGEATETGRISSKEEDVKPSGEDGVPLPTSRRKKPHPPIGRGTGSGWWAPSNGERPQA